MLFEKRRQWLGGYAIQFELVERLGKVAILPQRHQHPAHLGIAAVLDQSLLELGGLHPVRRIERRGERAVFGDQSARGLGADAEDAGNVVDRIAHQREDVADQFGRDPELGLDLLDIDPLALHGVEHVDSAAIAFADQLHQILVGGDDRDIPALRLRDAGIGGNQIVGLEPLLLDAGQTEGAGGIADQRELRAQILGRLGPVGLVGGVDVVAERLAILIEDHRQMGRPVGAVEILGQLPQHGGVAIDRAHRGPLRIGERREAVIGPENIGRPVDQIEMLLC